MKKYQLFFLIGIVFSGTQLFAEWCAIDQVRCYSTDKESGGSVEAGKLFNGELRQYEFNGKAAGCYPVGIDGPTASVELCNQIPACAGNKCIVAGWQNKRGTPGALTPLKTGAAACAPKSIDNPLAGNLLCTQICKEKKMAFSEVRPQTDAKCPPPNDKGSICVCRP